MKQTKVFPDSSVIIAGLASKKGESYEDLALAELKIIVPCISKEVVNEVFRNVQKKLPVSTAHFYTLFKKLPFKIKALTGVTPSKYIVNKAIIFN